MSRPPQTPWPWMRPPPREEDEDAPHWCEACQRMAPAGGCPACGDED